MTPQESTLLQTFLSQLVAAGQVPRDREADALIQRAASEQPDALYLVVQRTLSVMTTCGMYDAAGDWVSAVGMPAKSGVGGGILAVVPDRLSLVVWSPALDASGNSVLGQKALELFTRRTGLSIF